MKNTKTLFLISFFGCFILPIVMVAFSTFSIFFDTNFMVDLLFESAFIWVIAVWQIIIILITLMLRLTLKLKNVQSITTNDVVKGRRIGIVVKKVDTIELKDELTGKRKEIKVPSKIEVYVPDVVIPEVKETPKKIETPVVKEAPVVAKPAPVAPPVATSAPATAPKQAVPVAIANKPRPIVSNLKK